MWMNVEHLPFWSLALIPIWLFMACPWGARITHWQQFETLTEILQTSNNCKPCWYLVDNEKTVGEKAFKRSFFFSKSLTLTLWHLRLFWFGSHFMVRTPLLWSVESWSRSLDGKNRGMKFEAGEVPSAPCVVSRGYRYRLVGEESDFSKLNPFLEPKATAGGDCWWFSLREPSESTLGPRVFGEIIEMLNMSSMAYIWFHFIGGVGGRVLVNLDHI